MYMAEQPQGIAAPEQLDASDKKKVVRVVNNPETGKKQIGHQEQLLIT